MRENEGVTLLRCVEEACAGLPGSACRRLAASGPALGFALRYPND